MALIQYLQLPNRKSPPSQAGFSMIETVESQRGYSCARPLIHIVVRPWIPLKLLRDRKRHSIDTAATRVELEGKVCRFNGDRQPSLPGN